MNLSLPKPGPQYDAGNEAQTRSALEQADVGNQKRSRDIEIDRRKLILIAPNGSRWSVVVSNLGVISTVAL